ncbi:hypothetical protein ABZ135_15790, partial [Streptomyces sp. NPDC006339]|uniref:hypothetical protein n=1 Tax=Streptomyces sp. NPDC006339 TaxID=3156755 RepID=UPI0033AA4F0D
MEEADWEPEAELDVEPLGVPVLADGEGEVLGEFVGDWLGVGDVDGEELEDDGFGDCDIVGRGGVFVGSSGSRVSVADGEDVGSGAPPVGPVPPGADVPVGPGDDGSEGVSVVSSVGSGSPPVPSSVPSGLALRSVVTRSAPGSVASPEVAPRVTTVPSTATRSAPAPTAARLRLDALCRERAERSGELQYLLEPDLKEARGGLR